MTVISDRIGKKFWGSINNNHRDSGNNNNQNTATRRRGGFFLGVFTMRHIRCVRRDAVVQFIKTPSACKMVVIVLAMAGLNACSPIGVVAGGAATVGVAAAQEGGLKRAVSDAQIQLYINDAWLRHDAALFRKLDLTIKEGRVLITGVVQKPQHRVDAVRLAWQAPGVEQVINEIEVAESEGVKGFARDTLIASQLRAKITFDKEISSINYTIDVVGGNVYLMGVAQSKEELERVVNHARNLAYVKKVVSYVRIKNEQPVSEAVPENVQPAGEPEFAE